MTDVTLSIEKGWAVSALEIDYARKPGEPTPQIFLQGVNSRGNIAYTTRMTKAEAGELGAVLLALSGTEQGNLLTALRTALEAIQAHDRKLDDPHGDGSSRDAESPTGDDYNEVTGILQPLYDLLGMVGPLSPWEARNPAKAGESKP
jgi:hypothetical protein